MYNLFLALAVVLVVFSPLALDLYLTICESRHGRQRLNFARKAGSPGTIAWASARVR